MGRIERITDRLRSGQRIVIDGGTGTELERRGVPKLENAWNGGGTLSHPDVLRQIHIEHIEAGAEIIISNTFATSRYILESAGVGQDFDAYNRRSVELAVEARDHVGDDSVAIAGGLSHWSWTTEPTLDDIRRSAHDQAQIMAEAGADLLMLEMMSYIDKMLVMIKSARASGLPVWVGISVGDEEGTPTGDPGTINLRGGEPLRDALTALAPLDVDVLNIMHTDVDLVDGCLDVLDEHWSGIVGVYAHSGDYVDGVWQFGGSMDPARFAEWCAGWNDRGVQVHGGCCGTEPSHIKALKQAI